MVSGPLPGAIRRRGLALALDQATIEKAIETVSSLVGKITDWCRDQLAGTPRPKRP